MEKVKEVFAQVIAASATSAAMSALASVKVRKNVLCPSVTVSSPTFDSLELQKNIKNVLIDQIGTLVPAKNDNLFLQLTEIAAESVVTQSLSSFATYPFKMPNWKQLASDIATDAVKNTVYNLGRQKTDYGRIANNAVWGFAAGATAEWVQSKI